ncbi:hypothetical protein F1880_003896 [Penicillium rolfsii]|nr:hypothetical protein F1880_003896 [Penicillium rolfsii]
MTNFASHRFLGSEVVELCSSTRPDSIKIHRRLLEAKCGVSAAALTHDFKECTAMRMTFQETRYETVAQFVEWAYRGDYTEVFPLPIDLPRETESEPSVDSSSLEGGVKMSANDFSKVRTFSEITPSSSMDGSQAHTLLSHLRVYIFSDIYLVPALKDLAFEKFTAVLKSMGKPQSMTEQLAVIDCLALTFSKVPVHDKLPEWLAQHASWCVEELRLQSKFHDLLQRLPGIGSRMMGSLRPAQHPPWTLQTRDYSVPPYDARPFSDDFDTY